MKLDGLSGVLRPGGGFSIRSFGSWGEAIDAPPHELPAQQVSVSALSDRGVRPVVAGRTDAEHRMFQYPLFRIVG